MERDWEGEVVYVVEKGGLLRYDRNELPGHRRERLLTYTRVRVQSLGSQSVGG